MSNTSCKFVINYLHTKIMTVRTVFINNFFFCGKPESKNTGRSYKIIIVLWNRWRNYEQSTCWFVIISQNWRFWKNVYAFVTVKTIQNYLKQDALGAYTCASSWIKCESFDFNEFWLYSQDLASQSSISSITSSGWRTRHI